MIPIAKGKKTGGRDFQPGQPAGPGRPKVSPEIKEIRRLDQANFIKLCHLAASMTRKEAKAYLGKADASQIERAMVRQWKQAADGSLPALTYLTDRMFGRPGQDQDQANLELLRQVERLKQLPKERLKLLITQAVKDGSDEIEIEDAEVTR